MQFIVKADQKFTNNFYVMQFSFDEICKIFDDQDDEEVDSMIEKVAFLNINESYDHDFFGGCRYLFKRVS